MHHKVPILTYHSIDDSGSVISTSPQKFMSQMQILKGRGFEVISLKNLVDSIRQGHSLPPKTVAITFDDGFKSFYYFAYPVLQEFGFNATIFLVPGYIANSSKWNSELKGLPVLELLDWIEISEMSDAGIDFGAHSLNHLDLSILPPDWAYHEIVESKSMIQRYIRKEVSFFAYPYGKINEKIKELVMEEFFAACSADMSFASLRSDIYFLPRIDMYYFCNNDIFRFIGTRFFTFYVTFRSLFRSYRLLST